MAEQETAPFFLGRDQDMEDTKYRCPVCGAECFEVTAHVTQDWKIDCNGSYMESMDECVEVTHYPDEDDIWSCANCEFYAAGSMFRVPTDGQKGEGDAT